MNKKADNTGCGFLSGEESFMLAKQLLQSHDCWGIGKFRASKSGCLGRCESGPMCVVYPDSIWYSYVDEEDIKEIIEKHVINGEVITRLQI